MSTQDSVHPDGHKPPAAESLPEGMEAHMASPDEVLDEIESLATEAPVEAQEEAVESLQSITSEIEAAQPSTSPSEELLADDAAILSAEEVLGEEEEEPATPQAPRESESNAPQSVEALDDQIAGDLDALMDGDFESVEAVLDGVFDDQAAFVSPAEALGESIGESPAEPESVNEPAEPVATSASQHNEPPPALIVDDAAEIPKESIERGSVTDNLAISTAMDVAVVVLKGANYPLRLVPEKARPIVDWVALSLVFWVPIVWAAVFVFS